MASGLLLAEGCGPGIHAGKTTPHSQYLYVANRNAASVLAFPVAGPFGNVPPSTTIGGANTRLAFPDGLAVGNSGTIYVGENDKVPVSVIAGFSAGTGGNSTPAFTFTPTPALKVEGLVVDASGNIYVSSWIGSQVDVFGPRPSGHAAPSGIISGPKTLLRGPDGMALDSGKLYVADYLNNAICVFPANARGNVAPTTTIAGALTLLNHPGEVALDSSGRIIVANTGPGGHGFVLVFGSGARGNVAPVAMIRGAKTGLLDPTGVAVDSTGAIWVSDGTANAIYRFASDANRDVAPTAVLHGASTTLSNPQSLTIH